MFDDIVPGGSALAGVVRAMAATLCFVLVWCVAVPTSGRAPWPAIPEVAAQQSSGVDVDMDRLLERGRLEGAATSTGPVPPSTVSKVNLNVHWRLFKRVNGRGKSGAEELNALFQDGTSLGWQDMPRYAMATLSLVEERAEAGELDIAQAGESLEAAQVLAPHFPYPALARARLLAEHDPGRIAEIVSHTTEGLGLAWGWLDTRVAWSFNLLTLALLALTLSALLFLTMQLLRNFGVVAYDLTRLLPRGFSSNQAVILLLAAVIVPGLLMRSPLLSALLLLFVLSVIQNLRERVVTVGVFALLIALPGLERRMSDHISYAKSDARRMMHAQYVYCDEPCRDWLRGRVFDAADKPRSDVDPVVAHTWMVTRWRLGTPEALAEVARVAESREQWPAPIDGHVANLRGAVHVARAEPDAALELLGEAADALPQSAAPWLNRLRALQMKGATTEEKSRALGEASERSTTIMTRRMNLERRDINSFLMVPPLPAESFWDYHRSRDERVIPSISNAWAYLAGPKLPLDVAPIFGIIGLLLVLGSAPLLFAGRVSSPCPKCGMARDPEDDDETGFHHFCLICYRAFVSGTTLDFEARQRTEHVQNRRARIFAAMRRISSLLLPGAGHMLAGWAVFGFVVNFLLFGAALWLLRPQGIMRPPHELLHTAWYGQEIVAWTVLGAAVLVGLVGAIRDIGPRRVAEYRRRSNTRVEEDGDEVDADLEASERGSPSESHEKIAQVGVLVLHHLITALLVTAIFALAIWGYLTFRKERLLSTPERAEITRLDRHLLSYQRSRIEFALWVYFLRHDRHAANLEELVEDHLLSWADVMYASSEDVFVYQRRGGEFTLELRPQALLEDAAVGDEARRPGSAREDDASADEFESAQPGSETP